MKRVNPVVLNHMRLKDRLADQYYHSYWTVGGCLLVVPEFQLTRAQSLEAACSPIASENLYIRDVICEPQKDITMTVTMSRPSSPPVTPPRTTHR
eukprot:928026-Amphidinium_carterae.1